MGKERVPAIEGWFNMDEANPRLIGSQCVQCKTYYFPKESRYCKNPACDSDQFEEVELSARGKIWSYTNNCYPPPAPFVVTTEPFEPVALAGVELKKEGLIVLGELADGTGVEDVKVGQDAELVLQPLFEDEEKIHIVWKWKPVGN